MPYVDAGRHRMLDALVGTASGSPITHASLHTAAPPGNEVTGGTPAYARIAITFGAATGGAIDSTNTPVFDVPGATTVTHVGFYTALAAGTLMAFADVTDEAFGGQGTYTLTDADLDLNA